MDSVPIIIAMWNTLNLAVTKFAGGTEGFNLIIDSQELKIPAHGQTCSSKGNLKNSKVDHRLCHNFQWSTVNCDSMFFKSFTRFI